VITPEQFQVAIASLAQLLPMGKQLNGSALVMAWDTFPERAKRELTDEVLLFAVQQRVIDPAPPKDLAPHVALLRYAYPLENDRPVVERGLRSDLDERMASPDRFHDPAPVRQEQAPPSRMLPSGQCHPSQMTPEQRRQHLERVIRAVEKVRIRGLGDRNPSMDQLLQGKWWFERCLQGFWPLECDDGGIAGAWIIVNGRHADQLIQAALDGAADPVPAEGLVASFAGGR